MGISAATGLISGINFADLVNQLVQIEEQPILLLQSRKADLNTVSAELSTLSVNRIFVGRRSWVSSRDNLDQKGLVGRPRIIIALV